MPNPKRPEAATLTPAAVDDDHGLLRLVDQANTDPTEAGRRSAQERILVWAGTLRAYRAARRWSREAEQIAAATVLLAVPVAREKSKSANPDNTRLEWFFDNRIGRAVQAELGHQRMGDKASLNPVELPRNPTHLERETSTLLDRPDRPPSDWTTAIELVAPQLTGLELFVALRAHGADGAPAQTLQAIARMSGLDRNAVGKVRKKVDAEVAEYGSRLASLDEHGPPH
jgi:hypothetical protein